MKQYVIIGNGVAAAGVIEGIRSLDRESTITVISGESHPVYCRPLISHYLEGRTSRPQMNYRPADFYDQNGCTVLYGRKATAIDPVGRSVALDDGTSVSYDELCVATGSSPSLPPLPGLETVAQPTAFMTLDDALTLERIVHSESRVLILGAGLIGLKCAEGLARRARSVTLCDPAPHVLPAVLDSESAVAVEDRLAANGLHLLTGDSVERFDGHAAQLHSGREIVFDVLVTATGVRPNTELLANAGGRVIRGIVVNDHLATTLPHVYAAGDCVESFDVSSGQNRVLAIFPHGVMQGRCAGINMAGGEAIFTGALPMNALTLFGLPIMTAGSYPDPAAGGEVYEEKSAAAYKRLFIQDGRLVGMILIGSVERAGIYTRLIRERVKPADVDFEQLKHSPSLLPLGSEYRSKILGGVV